MGISAAAGASSKHFLPHARKGSNTRHMRIVDGSIDWIPMAMDPSVVEQKNEETHKADGLFFFRPYLLRWYSAYGTGRYDLSLDLFCY
jgi:hypothetical protein